MLTLLGISFSQQDRFLLSAQSTTVVEQCVVKYCPSNMIPLDKIETRKNVTIANSVKRKRVEDSNKRVAKLHRTKRRKYCYRVLRCGTPSYLCCTSAKMMRSISKIYEILSVSYKQ